MLLWNLGSEQGRPGLKASEILHRYECLLSSPVPSNFEGPSWQVSLAKHGTSSRKSHWSCNVRQKCLRDGMQGNMKPCYAFDRCWLLRSHRILSTGMSTPVTFKDIGFFSRDFRRNLLFHARLTWLGPSRPFCSRNIGWWDFSLDKLGFFGNINWHIDISAFWAHDSTSLMRAYSNFGRRPPFWLSFSNSDCDTSVSVCVCVWLAFYHLGPILCFSCIDRVNNHTQSHMML